MFPTQDELTEEELAQIDALCEAHFAKKQLQGDRDHDHADQPPPRRARTMPASLAPAPPVPLVPSLPFLVYRGKTSYFADPTSVDNAVAHILACCDTVSFDIEWRINYETGQTPRPVALMQLCYIDPSIYVPTALPNVAPPFRTILLHVFYSGITSKLQTLLTSTNLKKVGVGI